MADLDRQIARARRSKEAAAGEEDYESAAALRDSECQLLAEKADRQREWASAFKAAFATGPRDVGGHRRPARELPRAPRDGACHA